MPSLVLQPDERVRVTEILAALSSFADRGAPGRRVFLEQAGLQEVFASLDLNTHFETVAGEVVAGSEGYGALEGRPRDRALGVLANHLLKQALVPVDDRRFLAGLVVKYSLLGDQGYIDQLREKYGIKAETVRKWTPHSEPEPKGDAREPVPPVGPPGAWRSWRWGSVGVHLLLGTFFVFLAASRYEPPRRAGTEPPPEPPREKPRQPYTDHFVPCRTDPPGVANGFVPGQTKEGKSRREVEQNMLDIWKNWIMTQRDDKEGQKNLVVSSDKFKACYDAFVVRVILKESLKQEGARITSGFCFLVSDASPFPGPDNTALDTVRPWKMQTYRQQLLRFGEDNVRWSEDDGLTRLELAAPNDDERLLLFLQVTGKRETVRGADGREVERMHPLPTTVDNWEAYQIILQR